MHQTQTFVHLIILLLPRPHCKPRPVKSMGITILSKIRIAIRQTAGSRHGSGNSSKRPPDLPEICNARMFSPAEIKLNRDSNAIAEEEHMRLSDWRNTRVRLALVYVLAICSFQLYPLVSHAQNLGTQPATGQAVQGQTAAQPEGTVLNLVNWVGNVISPVGAALAVVMAVVSYSQGRGVARWAVTAAGLLVISGLTRLIEFWIQNGTAGVQ